MTERIENKLKIGEWAFGIAAPRTALPPEDIDAKSERQQIVFIFKMSSTASVQPKKV